MIAGVSTSGQGPLIIFAVQDLFYDQRVQAGTVGLSVLSMTLFGYGTFTTFLTMLRLIAG
jgi:hypothetical protein